MIKLLSLLSIISVFWKRVSGLSNSKTVIIRHSRTLYSSSIDGQTSLRPSRDGGERGDRRQRARRSLLPPNPISHFKFVSEPFGGWRQRGVRMESMMLATVDVVAASSASIPTSWSRLTPPSPPPPAGHAATKAGINNKSIDNALWKWRTINYNTRYHFWNNDFQL